MLAAINRENIIIFKKAYAIWIFSSKSEFTLITLVCVETNKLTFWKWKEFQKLLFLIFIICSILEVLFSEKQITITAFILMEKLLIVLYFGLKLLSRSEI